MIQRAAHAPPHLRSDFEDFAFYLTARHVLYECQPRRSRPRIPSRDPQLISVLDLGIQALQLHQTDLTVVTDEHSLVSGQTAPAVADAGAEEVAPEPVVEANALRHLDDVGADRLADVCDLVDERDPGHQERVRRELDHLRGRDVGHDDRGVDALVQRLHRRSVLRGERSDHNAVGIDEVVNRAPVPTGTVDVMTSNRRLSTCGRSSRAVQT